MAVSLSCVANCFTLCCKCNLFERKENNIYIFEFSSMNIACYSLNVGCGMYKYCITSDTDLHLGKSDIAED